MSATLPCAFKCGTMVNLAQPHYRRVAGWEKPRRTGGANQITLREAFDHVVACEECIRRGRFGILAGQEPLL